MLYNILAQKWVEYRPASDRSSLRIERAYFTQLSPSCDNSDDVFDIMVFDELVKKFELKVRARGWIILINQRGGVRGCLICVFFRITSTFLIYPTNRCFAFTVSMTVIVSTTNVGWRRSCWDSAFTTPDWSWFLTPTRHSLVNCCLSLSKRSTWSHMMGAAWLITWQRPPWSCTRNWRRCCHYTCIQQQAYDSSWFQWAATVWMQVMLSLKDSRHGLSSIYSLFSPLREKRNIRHCWLF